MTLELNIQEAIKEAMKAHDTVASFRGPFCVSWQYN